MLLHMQSVLLKVLPCPSSPEAPIPCKEPTHGSGWQLSPGPGSTRDLLIRHWALPDLFQHWAHSFNKELEKDLESDGGLQSVGPGDCQWLCHSGPPTPVPVICLWTALTRGTSKQSLPNSKAQKTQCQPQHCPPFCPLSSQMSGPELLLPSSFPSCSRPVVRVSGSPGSHFSSPSAFPAFQTSLPRKEI